MNTTTRSEVLETLTNYFYPFLKKTEDIESFTKTVSQEMRSFTRGTLIRAIERFDDEVRESAPSSWRVKDRPTRTVITLLGEVEYSRTMFIDEYGRIRYLTDEILGIRKKFRYSDDAFLWIVDRAAFVSFRKTARDFESLTDAKISHVSVMKMVHREGALLKEYLLEESSIPSKLSQETLFVEADGVFVALQSESKRKEAISRRIYESSRNKRSVELKCAVSYAGKTTSSQPTRKIRGNVLSACTVGDKEELFDMVASDIVRHYDAEDIENIITGSDGAACYREHGLDKSFTQASFTHCLDPFHIVRSLSVAFPDKPLRSKMLSLVYAREIEGFNALCSYLADSAETETERLRIIECTRYITNNAKNIRPDMSLGTMEGTISHTWAKRMKNNATSWSRIGAEAMGLIRAFVCNGRDLIAPYKQVSFTEKEKARKEKAMEKSFYGQPDTVGEGYLPHQANISHMRRSIRYRAAYP